MCRREPAALPTYQMGKSALVFLLRPHWPTCVALSMTVRGLGGPALPSLELMHTGRTDRGVEVQTDLRRTLPVSSDCDVIKHLPNNRCLGGNVLGFCFTMTKSVLFKTQNRFFMT